MRSYGDISLPRIVAFAALGALIALTAVAATQAAPASAQQPPPGSPAFCAQYPNHPACIDEVIVPPPPVTPPVTPPGVPGVDTAAAAPTAVAPAGTLPFTGYPITPLLLLLLILLAAGLTLRAYLAIRERIRERHAGPPGAA